MTIQEGLAMEKGTRVRFGSHPQIWTFFHYSVKRDDFASRTQRAIAHF